MTAASKRRRERRRANRAGPIVVSASVLAAAARADPTVTGATLMMPDGTARYVSVADALAMIGAGRPAGSA